MSAGLQSLPRPRLTATSPDTQEFGRLSGLLQDISTEAWRVMTAIDTGGADAPGLLSAHDELHRAAEVFAKKLSLFELHMAEASAFEGGEA